jgi:hypothetical protein
VTDDECRIGDCRLPIEIFECRIGMSNWNAELECRMEYRMAMWDAALTIPQSESSIGNPIPQSSILIRQSNILIRQSDTLIRQSDTLIRQSNILIRQSDTLIRQSPIDNSAIGNRRSALDACHYSPPPSSTI